jgi:Tat protein translocase TatB subunit
MFNVGGPEILVIFIVALIVLGPQQLPKAMRTFGSVMAEVRKVSNSFQAEMRNAMDSVVDTSATEKPHSATMATPKAEASSGAAAVEPAPASSIDEVVARNDAPTAEPSTPSAPGIDPADRAAG